MNDIQQEASAAPPAASPPAQAAAEPAAPPPAVDSSARLTEIESLLKERELVITDLQNTLTATKSAADKSAGDVKERELIIAKTLTALRLSLLQAHPDIPEELLTGQNVAELQDSLVKATVLVAKIKAQAPVVMGPAGAPARSGPDWSTMSPREKIVHALKGK